MKLTPSAKARIMLEGAIARHASRNHLRKQYVWETAKDVERATKRAKVKEQEIPLFEVKQ